MNGPFSADLATPAAAAAAAAKVPTSTSTIRAAANRGNSGSSSGCGGISGGSGDYGGSCAISGADSAGFNYKSSSMPLVESYGVGMRGHHRRLCAW